MKSRRILMALSIALAACFVFCASGRAVAKKAPKVILIGVNAPLTGVHAGFGEGNVWGEKAAVQDINKQGGIFLKKYGKRVPVRLVIVDNQSDPGKAGALEENLILKQKVNFLCDPNQPIPLAIPEAIAAERFKVDRVSGGTPEEPWVALRKQASPPWNHSWTYTLAIAAPSPKGSPTAKPGYTCMDSWLKVLKDYGDKTNKQVGVFASNEPDGRSWYSIIPKILKEHGLTPHVENNLGLFSMDTTDFTSLIQQWKRLHVQIVWGNSPAPLFGAMWRQCRAMGFHPKLVIATRAGLFYEDVKAWGDDLAVGVSGEAWWSPALNPKVCPGIGGTTPKSLAERWHKATGQPLNPGIGWGYNGMQILANAIQRAGSLNMEKVNEALAKTDMPTISSPRVKFDKNHSARLPVFFAQWQKVNKPWRFESKVVISQLPFLPVEAKMLFPIPYNN